jgi:Tfp pilus assembly protein PilV
MMAILVMTIGVTGLLAMQLTSLAANARAREISEAAQLCQDKVEQLRSLPLPLPTEPANGELVDARGCLVTGDSRAFCASLMQGVRYTRTWVIDPTMTNRFTVTASWITGDGSAHSVSVSDVR